MHRHGVTTTDWFAYLAINPSAIQGAPMWLEPLAVDHGGTRHRATYRLCLAAPECLAIIVSQDGSVQFVHKQAGQVIVWDQLTY